MAMPYGQPANSPGPGEDQSEDPNAPEGADESQTAFVPMELFPKTPSIGDTCTFKVVDVSKDGDVELEYVSSSSEKPASSGKAPPWETSDSGDSGEEY